MEMETHTDEEIFAFLKQDEAFFKEYLYFLMDRFVYSTAEIEGDMLEEKRQLIIENLLNALIINLNSDNDFTLPKDIITIGDLVNKESGITGLRKINVSAGKHADFTPSDSKMIYSDLYILLDNSIKIWSDLNTFLKEAYFHISFMRIHPFEDGNKRVAKIILTSNLIRSNCAPAIISVYDTDEYYNYLNNFDADGFSLFLKEKSHLELSNMIGFYKSFYKIPIEISINAIIESKSKK